MKKENCSHPCLKYDIKKSHKQKCGPSGIYLHFLELFLHYYNKLEQLFFIGTSQYWQNTEMFRASAFVTYLPSSQVSSLPNYASYIICQGVLK